MSCHVISKPCMDAVVALIIANSRAFCGIVCTDTQGSPSAKAGSEIGRLLFSLNAQAYAVRYREAVDESVGAGYTFSQDPLSVLALSLTREHATLGREKSAKLCEALKAAHSLEYQLSEGEIVLSLEYLALSELISTVSRYYIQRTVNYQDAKAL